MLRLKDLLAMPVFEYNDTERLKRLLTGIHRFSFAVIALVGIILILLNIWKPSVLSTIQLIVFAAGVVIFLLIAILLRWGKILFVALLLPVFMWLLITALTVVTGISGQGFVFYIVVILMAHMLLGVGGGVIFLAASLIASLVILYVDNIGILPVFMLGQVHPYSAVIVYWLVFLWVMGLIYISNRDLRQMLERTRQNEQALKDNNFELQTTRASLQTYARALERRIIHLRVAAEIARDTTSLDKVDELLDRTVNLVRDRFGFYHAGIFLVEGKYAVLRAATGDAGRQMLANNHQLKVGEVGIVGHVTGTGEPRIVLDVGADAVYFRNPYLPETRSEMALPLQVGSSIIGALDVQSKEPNAFQSEDISILHILADQMAVAIENARLYESAQRRLDELTILHTVANSAAKVTSQDELIECTTRLIGEKLYPDNFGVLLVDEATGVLRFHSSYRGLEDGLRQISYPIGHGIIGRAVVTGQSLRVSDVTRDPAYIEIHAGMRSELCVPLKVDGEIVGVINAEHKQPNAFTETDEHLLLVFAGQLATAIEKVRLFELATRRAAALEALRQAGLHVTSNLELNAVLDAILEHAIELVLSDSARIYLYDEEVLTFGTARWAEGVPHVAFADPRPNGLTYTVARTGRRMVVPDSRQHTLFDTMDWQGAMVGLPMRCGKEVIGVMNIVFEGKPHKFDDTDLRVLEMLADQAAIAITNAQLYADAQERAQALTVALEEREELDRLKDDLIQNVSHELRTPVAIIRGYSDLLEQGELGDLHPEQIEAVSVIVRRVNLLSKIVDDLTVMMEAEKCPVYREDVQLSELVKRALEDFRTNVEKASLTLSAEIAEFIPPIQGNSAHLIRLIDNLLGNAIKFTPTGGQIKVFLSYNGEENILQVNDTGVGIPPDKIGRIFERFYQVDGSTTRRYGGAGLGLALVREIAEAHGGRVSVESEEGQGSTFTVTFPLVMDVMVPSASDAKVPAFKMSNQDF